MAKLFIEDTTLNAIGDAIRSKTGKENSLSPAAMVEEINSLSPGEISIELTGKNDYRFYGTAWNDFISRYENCIATKDMTSASYMFAANNTIEEVPFDLNFAANSTIDLSYMFKSCSHLKDLPNINLDTESVDSTTLYIPWAFSDLGDLRALPENLVAILTNPKVKKERLTGLFYGCHSLRSIPMEILNNLEGPTTDYYNYLFKGFAQCDSLDELVNLPLDSLINKEFPKSGVTLISNGVVQNEVGVFGTGTGSGGLQRCGRAKNITFKTINGSPYEMKWAGQELLLENTGIVRLISVGDISGTPSVLYWDTGLTEATRITDDASYQALKNNPDSWTTNPYYSRYNRTSAVATINSLPDTSAYLATDENLEVNTIRFLQTAGKNTDGGAINTMTEEEIAVATAKGWTVAYTSQY